MKKQPLAPRGGNDKVYTPPDLALAIINHFEPRGYICEPCRGTGSFTQHMPECEWFELDEGKDFLASEGHWDWVVTNPPWSQLRVFLNKSMQHSDNVVFLCLVNAFFMKARQRDMKEHGFGMKEILFVDTPLPPWPQTGFSLGAVHIERGYEGQVKHTWLTA